MKTLTLLLISTLALADANMAWVDQKIEEIKPMRSGLDTRTLASLKNPFIYVKPKPKDGAKGPGGPKVAKIKKVKTDAQLQAEKQKALSEGPLNLQMIINTSALINTKWYKQDDDVKGYKLTAIQDGYVVLERKKKKIKLFIAQKNDKLQISTK